jgi:spore germination protein KA
MLKKLLYSALGFPNWKAPKGDIPAERKQEKHPLFSNIDRNKEYLQQVFDHCADIAYRDFKINATKPVKAFLVYVESLIDSKSGNESLLKAVMSVRTDVSLANSNIAEVINERLLTVIGTTTTSDLLELVNQVLKGAVALVIEGTTTAIICMVEGAPERPISEPVNEPGVRGPRDGFIEDYKTNIALIRRRLCSSRLKVENFELGEISKTAVVVLYLKGIVNEKIVEEVRQRISRIKIDVVLSSSVVEELIQDEAFSLFPLVQWTERPDKASASIAAGRIVIIVNNTPVALIVPITFMTMLQAAEDYFNEAAFSTFVRFLRLTAVNIALLLPATVVAIVSFHPELIPDKLFNTIATARQGLPFPIFIEVFTMELIFELLREAGIRMPRTIGQAVSIVGGLVIGQAAVSAGFIGPLPVVTVSLTAIASFAIPNYAAGTALRILRFFLIIMSGFLGGIGIGIGLMFILYYLAGLRSFGVPYLSPLAPWSPGDWKDVFVRVPWWAMLTRPRLLGSKEPVRQDLDQGPRKPKEGDGPQ